MSNVQITRDADAVLMTFMAACPEATADEVHAWSLRFPQFSAEIAEQAEAMRVCGPYVEGEVADLTPEQEARADRRAEAILDAAYGRAAKPQIKTRSAPAAERRWSMER